ncbi:MAG: glycosyltransferase, partial [Candidatus Aminicenantes bacterium]
YTLFHFPRSQIQDIENKRILSSFVQRLPCLNKRYRLYLPLFPIAIELFDLQEYDLIISSSHCVAKGAIPRPDALHICYVHSPMRYAWNQYSSYFSPERLGFFPRRIIPPIIHRLRIWDESSSHRVDHFVANAKTVADRIYRYYRRAADVVYPPVDTEFFQPGETTEDYFLVVSALVPYKRIDFAVETFNRTGQPLKIVGQGPEYKKLRKKARSNIAFLGALSSEDLLRVYQKARGLVMPGEEDFGINSLESQACGVPIIAFGRGGARETVLHGETGVLYEEPGTEGLSTALDKFKDMTFNKATVRANALKFSRDTFKTKISAYFQKKWAEHESQL